MTEKCGCGCTGGTNLIFACSGAADVGGVADRAARKLTKDGAGKMFCLAGIGGGVEGILKTTEAADKILAIDGCPLDCTAKCLQKAGFTNFSHLRLKEMGMEKGSTEVSDANIERVATVAKDLLAKA